MANMTKDWELYEAGKNYNNRIEPNYYDTVNANIDFYSGNQWRNLPDSEMPKPVFNIIKRVITFFVASLTTSKVQLHYEPLMLADNTPDLEIDAADVANAQTATLFDKFKMEFKTRDALFDGAITGDYCAHFYFDMNKRPYNYAPGIKGEICMELVDGTNVFFGNANNSRTDPQPYIIISGRDTVENLRAEARRYREMARQDAMDEQDQQESDDFENIQPDKEYEYQAGENGEIEVESDESGKALYIIVYRKTKKNVETGRDDLTDEPIIEEVSTITASKSVRGTYIYKDIDTGLSHYPIAWANWEKQKNTYRGRALATGLLPNQIFINRMFAMVMYHLMMTAFPKAVYNADAIGLWDNAIGEAIPLSGVGFETNIKNVAAYLEPANMSNQIVQVIELVMQYTKETMGISDAALGQIDPKNTSAIIAVQKSSAIPLENPKANLYEWVEDIGQILFDMMGTYYGMRPIVREVDVPDPMGGPSKTQKVSQMFDFTVFKDMWLDVKADVGESSYWSQIAANQTLDNMLAQGHIDIVQYLERVPDEYIPQKDNLIAQVQQRMMQAQMQAQL
ncbi:hypothetical protein DVH26_07755 [Paenibacillus sp. H1-7]|uniref:hypothetical protein n=1 Tax=Paenibacillus sp. H1-7 TaxID=2282849 RepID=UPI001EF86679|nr:hypothetical protein [Paenibacillus sp. H1-7]ULL14352.1 hypothetical protein DVH26_07755 [Paenibacillus sp. H1-7]